MRLSKDGKAVLYITIFLTIFGIIMVLSSSWPTAISDNKKWYYYGFRQGIFAILGFIVMYITSKYDTQNYKKNALWIFAFSLILCVLVFTPLGKEINYARRWIKIRSFSFMPSDFLKFASVNLAATIISKNISKIKNFKDGFLRMILLAGVSGVIVFIQPDLSTAIVIIGSVFCVFLVSGLNARYIFSTLFGVIVLGYLAIFKVKIGYSRIDRIIAFSDPLGHLDDEGWQLSQSLAAVSNGCFLGSGLGMSKQKFLYLSQAHNDFIFAIICEEFGFLGALVLIVSYFAFLVFGIRIALKTRYIYLRLLISGILFVIGIQAYVNMTVVTGLIPPTGLTLPFISYGGTSLMIMLGLVGIILNVDSNNLKNIEEKKWI